MSRYDLVIDGTPYSVDVVDWTGSAATVVVNGVSYQVELPGGAVAAPAPRPTPVVAAPTPPPSPPQEVSQVPASTPAPAAGEVVTAPMPGHILDVLVGVGAAVQAGDTLVLMEAMKMENEIKAHVAGTVRELKVSKGQDVGVGEVLAVIGS